MIGGVLHRFEAGHVALRVDARIGAAIANRRDRRVGGLELRVDNDAIGNREAGRCRQFAIRHDADADQHQIRPEPFAIR